MADDSLSTFSVFHRRGRHMDTPAAVLEGGGLRVECVGLRGSLPLDDSDHIRICVPLGLDEISLTTNSGDCAPRTALGADQIGIVRARRLCGLSATARTPVAIMWLDNEVFLRESLAVLGADFELVDDYVAPDTYLRRVGNVLRAGVRVGRPAQPFYLASLAREISTHVAGTYGKPLKHARTRGLSPERLARSLQVIEERLSEPLPVEELARRANMSAFHYARMFKSSTGHAPHFYITMRRVERAKEMLANGALPLARIAADLGYATQAHFTGVFRMHAGTTPHAYRLRCRSRDTADVQ